MVKVRFDRIKERLVFDHAERGWNGDAMLVLHEKDLTDCSVVDLKHALGRATEHFGDSAESVYVSTAEEEYIGEDFAPIERITFLYLNSELSMAVEVFHDGYEDDPEPPDFAKLLTALLDRHRLRLISAENDPYYAPVPPYLWTLTFGFSQRARTLGSLFRAGSEVVALLDAVTSGQFSRESIRDLITSGSAEVLIGQKEGHWLEAKRQHYDLRSLGGKVSLAQAVSRFCNSEEGGLVVVGAETKDKGAGDTIVRITPMQLDQKVSRKYRQALHDHLYPPPDGLQIKVVPHEDGELVLVDIPPQPEELKPFLVHGAVVDGNGQGAFISIVRRRDDVSIPTTAAMIHSTIAAGRALLRGEGDPQK